MERSELRWNMICLLKANKKKYLWAQISGSLEGTYDRVLWRLPVGGTVGVCGVSPHLAHVRSALHFRELHSPKLSVRAHVGFPASMLCQSSFLRDVRHFTPSAWVWSHYGLIVWLLIYSDAKGDVRSKDWLREVSPWMLIGALVSQGQLSGRSVIGGSGELARLVSPLPPILSVFFIINSLSVSLSHGQFDMKEMETEEGKIVSESKRGGHREGLWIHLEGNVPTVSKETMKWQLWYVTVPPHGLNKWTHYAECVWTMTNKAKLRNKKN